MQPQLYQHMRILAAPLTTTRCPLRQWDMQPRYMKRPTREARGHIIPLMVGIYQPPLSIITPASVMSRRHVANVFPILCSCSTGQSPIPLSVTSTRLWWLSWIVLMPLLRACVSKLAQHSLASLIISIDLTKKAVKQDPVAFAKANSDNTLPVPRVPSKNVNSNQGKWFLQK